MNKQTYMRALKKKLHRLPKADFDKAIEYFEEYFADAGIENEAKAIQDLGSPEEAAEQIIRTIAINNASEPIPNAKKGVHAVWVGILALFAAPIALPLTLMLALVIILVVAAIFLVLLMLFLAGIMLILMGPITVIAGITVLLYSVPTFVSCIGLGLCSIGLGLLLCCAMIQSIKSFFSAMSRFFVRLINRKRKTV